MKSIRNIRLSTNFMLYEFIEAQLPPKAVALNWKHINEFKEKETERLAHFLQSLRNSMNQRFRSQNNGNEIGIRITSGFRCRAWELYRNRSGQSQHCVGVAADIQPTGCSPGLAVQIMEHYFRVYNPRQGGHFGGFAIKRPTMHNGKIKLIGFLHYDLRGYIARWEY